MILSIYIHHKFIAIFKEIKGRGTPVLLLATGDINHVSLFNCDNNMQESSH